MTEDHQDAAATSGRLQKLLEKINPEARLERLRKDRDALQERLFDALAQARLQDALVAASEAALASREEGPDEQVLLDGRLLSRTERDRLDLATSRYYQDANWRVVEATSRELEAVIGDLEGAAQIGTRAARRRASRG